MITTRIINDDQEIAALLPECKTLARNAGGLPFHQIDVPLLWWKHFNSLDGADFASKRNRNFFGLQSWVEAFHLVIAEKENEICGLVPLVSTAVKISAHDPNVRILSFAGDSVLIAYQDMLVRLDDREAIVEALFQAILNLARGTHDVLFLGNIPESSPNLPLYRKLLPSYLNEGLDGGETINRRRGGVQPWTIDAFRYHFKSLLEKVGSQHPAYGAVVEQTSELENSTSDRLLFPQTRQRMENRIKEILSGLANNEQAAGTISAISEQLSPSAIQYPYIKLPQSNEAYLNSLSKETRRYFRRYKARFLENGGGFEKVVAEEVTSRDIDDYLALHQMRWGRDSVSLNDTSLEFHRELSMALAKAGQFSLFFATDKNARIACHSCIDILDRREGYYTGRDPALEELRAGRLLYMETILDAIAQGFSIYDLGYGGDEYKLSFTEATAHVSHLVLAPTGHMPDLQKLFPRFEYVSLER